MQRSLIDWRFCVFSCLTLASCSVGSLTHRYMTGELVLDHREPINGLLVECYSINGMPTLRKYFDGRKLVKSEDLWENGRVASRSNYDLTGKPKSVEIYDKDGRLGKRWEFKDGKIVN